MPNIIPQDKVSAERDISPVATAKRRQDIYGNYKRPVGTEIDATLDIGYMPIVKLPTAPEYMRVPKQKSQQIDTKNQLY